MKENSTVMPFAVLENTLALKKSPLFASVQVSELRYLAIMSEEVVFDKGDIVFNQEEIGDSLYLIKEGSVKIRKKATKGEWIDLATLKDGESFGEMSVIDEEVRSASVVALQKSILLRINKENLHEVIRNYPDIGIELLKTFVKRLRVANNRIDELVSYGSNHQ